MLTTEDLLSCDKVPNICDVSLELYKDFSNKYLLDKVFTYEFTDGDSINVRFTEWGIYHMLAIQHIDNHIKKTKFFSEIDNGLSFDTFKCDLKKNIRFKRQKKRITMFACVYNTLLNGMMFYLPSGKVKNTAEVEVDYISYDKLMNVSQTGTTYNGINIGLRKIDENFIPLTILVSTNSNIEEYIENEQVKIIKCLTIRDNNNNVILEKFSY